MSSETLMPFVRRARYQPSQSTIVFGITVVLALFLSAALSGFLTLGNLFTLARNISILGILALGMTVVVIGDRKSTRLNSSHEGISRMPSSA